MIAVQRILCPIDFSDCSRRALEYAVAMARWYGARVTATHVFANVPMVDPIPIYRGQAVALREADVTALQEAVAAFVRPVAGDIPVETALVESADVREEIVTQANVANADLIVMGTHGRSGIQRALIGSVAERVIRSATCPVLVVPPYATDERVPLDVPFTRILCAVDFSEYSARALELALELAQEADGHLTLVHAIELPPELGEWPRTAEFDVVAVRAAAEASTLTRLRALVPSEARVYCKVHTDAREGAAHREILAAAREHGADLIVMGVHGRGFFDRLVFGSTTHAVVTGAHCPVLVVRPVVKM